MKVLDLGYKKGADLVVGRDAIEQMVGHANFTENQIERASLSTLRKMRSRIETKVKRYASQRLRVPQKAFEGRVRSVTNAETGELKIWFGTWSVMPWRVGSPLVYGKPGVSGGVRVGRYRKYPGAFYGSVYSNQDKVWIRLSSKHYSPSVHPSDFTPGGFSAENSGRFPVVRIDIPIDDEVREVLEYHADEFMQEFDSVFKAELNYFVNIRGERMNPAFAEMMNSRLLALVDGLSYDHEPSGAKVAVKVYESMLPDREPGYQVGDDFPFVRWAIYGGGFDHLRPQPFKMVINCGLWTADVLSGDDVDSKATIIKGTREIQELVGAIGKIVQHRTFKPFRMNTPVPFMFGDMNEGGEGVQPHPYYYGRLLPEFIVP